MSDIKIGLSFDYSHDVNFSPAPYPGVPHAVEILDPHNIDHMVNYFKTCGWFSVWGKELEGIDVNQVGGNAFLGDNWLFMRKEVEFSENEFYSEHQFVRQIEAKTTLKNGGNAVSPVVIAMNIDGVKVAILFHKHNQFIGGPCQTAEFVLKNAKIPFPANATWGTHPAYYKGCAVHNLALSTNQVDIKIEIGTSEKLDIGWLAVDDSSGGSFLKSFGGTFVMGADIKKQLLASSPNTAIAKLVGYAFDNGNLSFGKAAELPPKKPTKKPSKKELEIRVRELEKELEDLRHATS